MKLVFAGTPKIAAQVLDFLVSSGHEVVCVLTRSDAVVGRKREEHPSAVAIEAAALGIPVIKANRVTSNELKLIQSYGAELGVVVAYGSLLKPEALESLENGWFNLHFSMLPKYQGAAPVQRALIDGQKETGVTFFKLDEGMDTGLIAGSVRTEIMARESAGELLTRLTELGCSLLSELLPKLYTGILALQNQVGEPSSAPKPTRTEARIDFTQSAGVIENLVRGMNPEPMAWCLTGELPMRIIEASERSLSNRYEKQNFEPGVIYLDEGRVLVACGSGSALELLVVQPTSKRAMEAKSWYNGNRRIEKLS